MNSEFIIETPARNRYSMYDFANPPPRENPVSRGHSFNVSDLPQRSRSVMNLTAPAHYKKRTWMLPESPTVSEKQVQLTKRRTIAGSLSPPTPAVPRVDRYLEIFEKLKTSYSGFLRALDGFNHSEFSPKDALLFQKCSKRLNSRLKKLQDLNELYIHQEHMREGARNLLNTMERESSKKIRNHIDDVKSNYKKNVTRLCAIEDEINGLAGSIKVQIIGLIGFARLSPGDIYEVQLKHSYGKFVSKCKVVGQGQKWTNPVSTFRVSLMHEFQVKVHEVRKMNSNNIGVVGCPIANFISCESQEFVLPVNSTGTLKLKLGAVWSPFSKKEETAFHGKITITELPYSVLDSLSDSSLPSSPCSTPKNGTLSSMPRLATESATLTPMKISVDGTFLSPEASIIRHSRMETSAMEVFNKTLPKDSDITESIRASSVPNIAALSIADAENEEVETNESSASKSPTIIQEETEIKSDTDNNNILLVTGHPVTNGENQKTPENDTRPLVKKKPRPVTLGPTFTSAHSMTADYENVDIFTHKQTENTRKQSSTEKGRPNSLGPSFKAFPSPDYSPLKSPELAFARVPIISSPDYSPAQSPLKDSAPSPAAEVPKIEVESEPLEDDESRTVIRSLLLEMLNKIASFSEDLQRKNCLEELSYVLNQLLELLQEKKHNLARTVSVENALNSIDTAFDFLSEHQNLNSDEVGPKIDPERWNKIKEVLHHHLICCGNLLKQEKITNQLSKQIDVLRILDEALRDTYNISSKTVCEELRKNMKLACLWDEVCTENQLYCTKDGMLMVLRGVNEREATDGSMSDEVLEIVLEKLQQRPPYSGDLDVISVFQFTDFFSRGSGVFTHFEDAQKELTTLRALKSNDELVVRSKLQDRRTIPIVRSCMHHLAMLLTSKNSTMQKLAGVFLTTLASDAKSKAVDIYIEELKSKDEPTLIAACHALRHLEAFNANNDIGNVWKTSGTEIRKAAFEAMKVVGFPEDLETSADRKYGFPEAVTKL